jgi:hypothetical protein
MSLREIIEDLNCNNKNRKGIALEALAFYFCRRLDLSFVQWRLRGKTTSGEEAALSAEGRQRHFRRWQIRCKAATGIARDDLAKEVGTAAATRSTVLLLISVGRIEPEARRFAARVMSNVPVRIVCIGHDDLLRLAHGTVTLLHLLRSHNAGFLVHAA